MRPRKKLLFLAQTLPYPPDAGVAIRTYHVLRLLERDFDVTALCFYRRRTKPAVEAVEAAREGLSGLAAVEAFPIRSEHDRRRLLVDHTRSVLTGRPYTHFTYASADFTARLEEHIASERFALAHVDSLDLVRYLPALGSLPIVCAHHNVESQLLRDRATRHRLPVSSYMRLQANLTEGVERKWCPHVATNVVVSEDDKRALAALAPSASFVIVPNGVDTEYFQPRGDGASDIVTVGGTSWFPNLDGLSFFAEEVLPHVRSAVPGVESTWVGRAKKAERERFLRAGIRLTGYVDDIRPFVANARCFVVPLRLGGGTRLKILDAWAMGKAVVTTSAGCRGLAARDGDNILVRDDPRAFADAVVRVLRDPDLRKSLEERARETAVRDYDWEVVGEEMLSRYHQVASAGAAT